MQQKLLTRLYASCSRAETGHLGQRPGNIARSFLPLGGGQLGEVNHTLGVTPAPGEAHIGQESQLRKQTVCSEYGHSLPAEVVGLACTVNVTCVTKANEPVVYSRVLLKRTTRCRTTRRPSPCRRLQHGATPTGQGRGSMGTRSHMTKTKELLQRDTTIHADRAWASQNQI